MAGEPGRKRAFWSRDPLPAPAPDSTAHQWAAQNVKDRITGGAELVGAVGALIVAAVIYAVTGHWADFWAVAIGAVSAILFGLVIQPAAIYLWSQLTFTRRTIMAMRAELAHMSPATVVEVAAPVPPAPEPAGPSVEGIRAILDGELDAARIALDPLRFSGGYLRLPLTVSNWSDLSGILAESDPLVYTGYAKAYGHVGQLNRDRENPYSGDLDRLDAQPVINACSAIRNATRRPAEDGS